MSPKLSPELSELAVYCKSVPFRGFENLSEKPPDEMSSFSENDALRHIKDSGKAVALTNNYTAVKWLYADILEQALPIQGFGIGLGVITNMKV